MSLTPAPLAPDIERESPLWDAVPEAEAILERALAAAAGACKRRLLPGAEVSVLLTDDARMREINREWRSQDKPTNVLSFPAVPVAAVPRAPFLGDIAIAFETVRREAADEGKRLADHLAHLGVHGFLHLVGYDHETDAQAQEMESLEVEILAAIDIADPYADTVPAAAAGAAS